MDRTYNINELAMMTGFTTRTIRNYINQGLLNGNKVNGVWQFTAENIEEFFAEPFVKEGLRIKGNSIVFDFLSGKDMNQGRSCVILDRPVSGKEGDSISSFFCRQMEDACDVVFRYDWNGGHSRVILSGAEEQVAKILKKYYEFIV